MRRLFRKLKLKIRIKWWDLTKRKYVVMSFYRYLESIKFWASVERFRKANKQYLKNKKKVRK